MVGQTAQETRAGRFVDLFEPLTETEYEHLKRDIELRGIVYPIVVDQEGEIVDGHNRKAIADELGIRCPQIKRIFADDDERTAYAIALNLFRRHISKPKRQGWIWTYEQLTLAVDVPRRPKPKPTPPKTKPDTTMNERQRRHRLRELIRPKQAPSPFADPWEIAAEILHAITRIRSMRDHSEIALELDQLEERVRQLAWGPEE